MAQGSSNISVFEADWYGSMSEEEDAGEVWSQVCEVVEDSIDG